MEESVTTGRFLGRNPVTNASGTEVNNTLNPYELFSETCDTEFMIMAVVIFIIAVTGVAGNAIVIWLLGFRMRRNVFSVYILNLAAADLIVLFFYFITLLYTTAFPSAFVNDSYIEFSFIVLTSSYLTGLGLLSAISMERCLSVLCPIWYRCHRPRHMSLIITEILWVLPLVFGILWWKCFTFHSHLLSASIAIYLSALFLILCGSNLGLLGRVCCATRRFAFTRLYVTILLTFLVFLFCGLPLGIFTVQQIYFLFTFHFHLCYPSLVLVILSCVNSAANPVIYFFVGSFRQSKHQNLRLVLQKALQDTPERDEHVGIPPQETLEMSGHRVEQA